MERWFLLQLNKKCTKYATANRRNRNVKPRSCSVNHIGSSVSMEAISVLELAEKVFDK